MYMFTSIHPNQEPIPMESCRLHTNPFMLEAASTLLQTLKKGIECTTRGRCAGWKIKRLDIKK